jgi:cytochrome c553
MNPPVLVAGAAIAALSISTLAVAAEDAFVVPAWPYPGNPPSSIAATPPVYACGYCHLPDGQGRPENAPLAGLPATYIRSQVADFGRGARRSAWHGTYLPTDFMRSSAENAADEEIAAAASYFSALPMTRRVEVIEAIRIPKIRDIGWLYVPIEGDGTEPLGLRIIEVPLDHERHELRDSRIGYRA